MFYQPQVDGLEDDDLSAHAAVALVPVGQAEPIFGAVWIESRIETDLDTRRVRMEDVRVSQVRFPEATPELEQGLVDLLTTEIPLWNLELSLDRLSAMLEVVETQTRTVDGFNDDPPKIQFVDYPAVLVTIDGTPRLRKHEESGIQYVVNTPFLIAQDPKKGDYYLYGGADSWYRADSLEGDWEIAKKVPKKIRKLQPEDEEVEVEEDGASVEPPAIIVTTEPMELIVTDGPPEYTPIAGGELLVVANSESDILVEIATQRTFVLLSGRWFAAPSTDGPWSFVPSDGLPETFSEIDPDSDQGYLLAWVADTEMAREVVLDSHIPQTAAIKRSATMQVEYDGDPVFEPIEETTLHYAVNTEYQVIQAGSRFYCAYEGAWYVAESAAGPWSVATEVPEEIQGIPASSPVYNTKYVHVYDSTPEVVYVGYYPGYTDSYIYHGSLVYGTGWYYNPWLSPRYYYPRVSTWGFHVRWNPWSGWAFGFSYSTGRWTFSLGYGGWYGRGWWGPRGYRGYRHGYNRGWNQGYRSGVRSGYSAGYRSAQRNAGRNIYQQSNNASRLASTQRGGTGSATGVAAAAGVGAVAGAGAATAGSTRANNVYSDRNGNVYRQGSDGSWQNRQDGQWKPSQASGAAASVGQRPTSTTGAKQPPSYDAKARNRGNQRAQSYQRSGGGRRGGGGRRR